MKFLVLLLFLILTPIAAFASEDGVEPHMIWRVIDFVLFAGIIYYYAKKPIADYFRTRKETIESTFKEAEKLKIEAEQLLKETEEKLSQLEDEMKKIIETFSSMADKEKESILKDAETTIKRLKDSIEEEKVFILNKAKLELLRRMTKDAIANVKDKLSSINTEEHSAINKKFIRGITQ